jgi:hypothetical protein
MSKRQPRNPGPPGGYRIIRLCHKLLPRPVFSCLLAVGSGVAVHGIPLQRRHSREYLRLVLGRGTLGNGPQAALPHVHRDASAAPCLAPTPSKSTHPRAMAKTS